MSAIATPVIESWMYGVLSGDATLSALATGGIYRDVAPEGSTYPLVLFNCITSTLNVVMGGRKLWEVLVFEVKAIDRMAGYANLVTMANRIDTLLHQAPTQAITGGTLQSCISDGGINRTDPPASGVIYSYLGSRYRVYAQAP